MSDPNWSNTVRDDLHGDLGYGLGLGGLAHALELFFHPQANQCLVTFLPHEDLYAVVSNFKVTACEIGTDTDSEGRVFMLVKDEAPGAGQVTLEFYKGSARDSSAGNEKVATAAGNNSTTLTITPESGYTLAGTVDVGVIDAGLDENESVLHVAVPPAQRLPQVFAGDQTDDAQIRAEIERACVDMAGSFRTAKQRAEQATAFVARTKLRRLLLAAGITSNTSLLVTTRNPTTRAVSYSGLLHDFVRAQAANTGGAGEIKAAAHTLSGSITFPGWQGTATGPTYGQRGVGASCALRCVKTMNATPPQFQITITPTDARYRGPDGSTSYVLPELLTIGEEYSAKEWGIEALTLDYKASVSDVTDGLMSTTAGDWSVSGLTSSNSSAGVLWGGYDGSTIKFYKTEAGRDAEDEDEVVASVTTTTGQTAAVKTAEGATGIAIVFKTGAGSGGVLVSGSEFKVDFQVPTVTGNSMATLTITETEGGEWQKRMSRGGVGGVAFYPNTGSSPNLTDAQIRAGLPLLNVGVSGARY
jgi:hypothetical protein